MKSGDLLMENSALIVAQQTDNHHQKAFITWRQEMKIISCELYITIMVLKIVINLSINLQARTDYQL